MYNVVSKKTLYNALDFFFLFPNDLSSKGMVNRMKNLFYKLYFLVVDLKPKGSSSILRSIMHIHSNLLHERCGKEGKASCKSLNSSYTNKLKIVNFSLE